MKNIILLSDGTGNSAAKRNKTNVLRLYQAMNLHLEDQVAFYDDGVGSEQFLPLKILGGVFGFGLKRNVLQLYRFLCRTYNGGNEIDPEKKGEPDRIYLFGFSRGAFTVRVLAGLIAECGLYTKFENERDLYRAARRNYTVFRSKFVRKGDLFFKLYRWCLKRYWSLKGEADEPQCSEKPDIEFIGVWDTVDAYGFPIEEFAVLWDRLIFPIRFPDQDLSPKVKRACQALSIDDERLTFHPLLWNECPPKDKNAEKADPKRIEQVWFPGMHSDVGGGYPLNNLALVALDWMIAKVEFNAETSRGLHFITQVRNEIEDVSDWHGKQYDSRSGLGAYYRYSPRDIAKLCRDEAKGVTVENPKIHRAVFERIKGKVFPYAPTGLPATYQVVTTRGSTPEFENTDKKRESIKRVKATNHALDVIYWRKWLNWTLLLTTIFLLFTPTFLSYEEDWVCSGRACFIDPLFKLVAWVLPDSMSAWVEGLRQNPVWFSGFVIAFGVLFWLKRVGWRALRIKATAAWAALKWNEPPFNIPPEWKPTLTSRLRSAFDPASVKGIKKWFVRLIFALFLILLLMLTSRMIFHVRGIFGHLYTGTAAGQLVTPAPTQVTSLDISNPCFATGIALQKGRTYCFTVSIPDQKPWYDGSIEMIPAAGDFRNRGFSEFFWFGICSPIRRHFNQPWFMLMGRIDNTGDETFAIGEGLSYTAKSDGELFLYVNDAVIGVPFGQAWSLCYSWKKGRNQGKATVTVTLQDD